MWCLFTFASWIWANRIFRFLIYVILYVAVAWMIASVFLQAYRLNTEEYQLAIEIVNKKCAKHMLPDEHSQNKATESDGWFSSMFTWKCPGPSQHDECIHANKIKHMYDESHRAIWFPNIFPLLYFMMQGTANFLLQIGGGIKMVIHAVKWICVEAIVWDTVFSFVWDHSTWFAWAGSTLSSVVATWKFAKSRK